jgi:CrcB protein
VYGAAVERARVLALAAAGGVLGALARFGLDEASVGIGASTVWATLSVNLLGAFAIGMAVPAIDAGARRDLMRPFVITGVLGGFTTMSAFAGDAIALLDSGRAAWAAAYVAATLAGGLVAVSLGRALADRAAR